MSLLKNLTMKKSMLLFIIIIATGQMFILLYYNCCKDVYVYCISFCIMIKKILK